MDVLIGRDDEARIDLQPLREQRQNRAASSAVALSVSSSEASNSGSVQTGSPSPRQWQCSAQRGSCSPGYCLPTRTGGPRRATKAPPSAATAGPRGRAWSAQARRCSILGLDVRRRDEGRLAAHRQPHVPCASARSTCWPARQDRPAMLLGIGFGRARGFAHARDRHREVERDLALLRLAGNRRGRDGIGARRQRDMTLARKEAGGRLKSDPSRTGQIHFGPGVQVGEVGARTRRTFQRLHVGRELDEVARYKPRRVTEMAQHMHEQPRGITARAPALPSVSSGDETPGSMRTTYATRDCTRRLMPTSMSTVRCSPRGFRR